MTGPRHIDRNSDRPAYKQLADILRDQIQTGELAAGTSLPSKAQLKDAFRCSINTVEGALRELKQDGLIVSERGRNSRVRPVRVLDTARYTAGLTNYNPDQESRFAKEHGVPWADFNLARVYKTAPAPPRIAEALRLAVGAPVVQRRWIHAIDGVVLRVAWSYLDEAKFGHTILCDPDEAPWRGGTIAQLKHLGHNPVVDPLTEVRERPATPEEQDLLAPKLGWVMEEFRIHIEQSPYFGEWTPLEASVRVYPLGAVVLAFNGTEHRKWNDWQG